MEIRQIKQAWEEVKPQTIAKCFSHCGEIPQEQSTEDQSAGLDDDNQDDATARLQKLVNQLGSGIVTDEYKAADHDLHVCACVSFDDSVKWREELRDTVRDDMESFAKIPAAMQDDDNDDEEEPEVEQSTIHNYDEALKVTNDLMLFFTQQGEEELSDVMFKTVVDIQAIKLKSLRN